MPNHSSLPVGLDLLVQGGERSANSIYQLDKSAEEASSGETTKVIVIGAPLSGSQLEYQDIKQEKWDDEAQQRWAQLLEIRANGQASAEENIEFEKLQALRRGHDAVEDKQDLPAVWAKIKQDRIISALLKEYASRATGNQKD